MSATYTAPFELRRLVIKWARVPSGVVIEDAAATTIHFAKLTGGAVDSNWLTADYTSIEARVDTWWTAIKVKHPPSWSMSELRWYKAGPVFAPDDRANGPSNPATRIATRNVVATGAFGASMPPQTAITITLVTPIRKRWGRMYLPTPESNESSADGRISTVANWLTPTVALFNGCRADGHQPVVFSRGRSSYTTSKGTLVAAHAASAYEISDLQCDNQFDVMQSRRWSAPTVRSRTTLT